jgi:hypothetical protein
MTTRMPFVYEDFVDRNEEIAFLHSAIKNLDQRVILLEGQLGSGKTSLLEEFHAEIPAAGFTSVYIDLSQRTFETGYLFVVLEFPNQLGPQYFTKLIQSIRQIRLELTTPARERLPEGIEPAPQSQGMAGESGGGIDIHGDLHAPYANIAGRDIIQIINQLPNLDSTDNFFIMTELTTAFQGCLIQLSSDREVVFLLDHWEECNDQTRQWIQDHLIKWTLRRQLSKAILVIASLEKPGWYRKRRDISPLELGDFSEEAIRSFWVDVHGLPLEALGEDLSLYAHPARLVLEATRLAQKIKRASGDEQ